MFFEICFRHFCKSTASFQLAMACHSRVKNIQAKSLILRVQMLTSRLQRTNTSFVYHKILVFFSSDDSHNFYLCRQLRPFIIDIYCANFFNENLPHAVFCTLLLQFQFQAPPFSTGLQRKNGNWKNEK